LIAACLACRRAVEWGRACPLPPGSLARGRWAAPGAANLTGDLAIFACVLEVFLILVAVATSAISRRSRRIQLSLEAVAETTRGARSQWSAVLLGIVGANAGYVLLIGSYILATASGDPVQANDFWIPTAIVAYLLCGLPTYLGFGAIIGLLVDRYAKRNWLPSGARLVLLLVVSGGVGALLAVPVFLVGVMGAAL